MREAEAHRHEQEHEQEQDKHAQHKHTQTAGGVNKDGTSLAQQESRGPQGEDNTRNHSLGTAYYVKAIYGTIMCVASRTLHIYYRHRVWV